MAIAVFYKDIYIEKLQAFLKIFNWRIFFYNVVLVSSMQKCESGISIHISPPLEPLKHFLSSAPQVKTQAIRRLVHLIHPTAPI